MLQKEEEKNELLLAQIADLRTNPIKLLRAQLNVTRSAYGLLLQAIKKDNCNKALQYLEALSLTENHEKELVLLMGKHSCIEWRGNCTTDEINLQYNNLRKAIISFADILKREGYFS